MAFDVTFQRMSSSIPQHLLHLCHDIEKAIELTREQYPGCLIISVLRIEV